MAKVRVTAILPTERADGTPIPVSEVEDVVLEQKLASAPATAWSQLGPALVPAGPTVSLDVNNVPAGNWVHRATFSDKLGGPDVVVVSNPLQIALSPMVGGSVGAVVVP